MKNKRDALKTPPSPGSPEEHAKDLLVACQAKGCEAEAGRECAGLPAGVVHIGRRILRLLTFRWAPEDATAAELAEALRQQAEAAAARPAGGRPRRQRPAAPNSDL